MFALQRYGWPGNVRELQNVIERAVILARGGPLQFDLPTGGDEVPRRLTESSDGDVLTYAQLRERERANVIRALEQTGYRVSGEGGAAELLGVRPTTLASRMKAMGIERPR